MMQLRPTTYDITFDDTVDVDVNVDAVHVYVH